MSISIDLDDYEEVLECPFCYVAFVSTDGGYFCPCCYVDLDFIKNRYED